ncbi:hypothetical protein B0H13DRAFT_1851689 [Mycena leptocephala]|nr:hypothetical protein B0H13DRAFT_1851689 [Mycena leptocephala]
MTSLTAVFPSVTSFVLDNAQNSSTRWLSGIARIKPLKEWLCERHSWDHRDLSLYKMISIVSVLNSSVVDEICVIQGSNGKFVFTNGVDSAVMNLEGMLDFLTWHLRQQAACEAAIFAAMPCLKSSNGRLNTLGPISLTCDGWYSSSDFDSDELPDLIDADM